MVQLPRILRLLAILLLVLVLFYFLNEVERKVHFALCALGTCASLAIVLFTSKSNVFETSFVSSLVASEWSINYALGELFRTGLQLSSIDLTLTLASHTVYADLPERVTPFATTAILSVFLYCYLEAPSLNIYQVAFCNPHDQLSSQLCYQFLISKSVWLKYSILICFITVCKYLYAGELPQLEALYPVVHAYLLHMVSYFYRISMVVDQMEGL